MLRDITMIGAVLTSIFSVTFGVYQNFQAKNNHAFIYEQAYKIIGAIQQADIPAYSKAQLTDRALGVLGTPAPVIDLSQSSADAGTSQAACSDEQKASCSALANDLAGANAACVRSKGASDECPRATGLKSSIISRGCAVCYTH
jgi:hypothetical protein